MEEFDDDDDDDDNDGGGGGGMTAESLFPAAALAIICSSAAAMSALVSAITPEPLFELSFNAMTKFSTLSLPLSLEVDTSSMFCTAHKHCSIKPGGGCTTMVGYKDCAVIN